MNQSPTRSCLLNISRDMMRLRLNSKLISSALSRRLATTASGGRDFHPKVLLMEWICPPHLRTVPELYGKK
jgi:hypothetical protein